MIIPVDIWTAGAVAIAPTLAVMVGAVLSFRAARVAAAKVETVRQDLTLHNQSLVIRMDEIHLLVNSQLTDAVNATKVCHMDLALAKARIAELEIKRLRT